MTLPEDKKQNVKRLRSQAESQIDKVPRGELLARPAEELLHELQVHQIELEMQNDALRKAEIALAESRDRYVDLYEFAPVGYLTLSTDGMIVEANLTSVTLLGKTRRILLQSRFTPMVIAEDQDRWIRHFMNVKQGDGGRSVELSLQRGDSTVLQAQLDCVRAEGSSPGVRIALIDISERKQAEAARLRLEDQLRESQKMEALGTLAGGVAHDFNNALAVIIGHVELARQDVGPGHAALESLEEIGKAGRRAEALVQQILAFGRRQITERKVIPLAPIVEESVRLLRATLPAAVSLTVECAAAAPVVLADAGQIEQVVLNLCNNARYAITGQTLKGTIEIRLEACEREPDQTSDSESVYDPLGPLQPGRYACLSVRDNGVGMDAATQRQLFEPFFTTKPVDEGSGLGLSVVYGIVRGHQGVIQVQSQPGEGAVFRIYFPEAGSPASLLPARGQASARARDATAPALPGDGLHVLYIDDEQAIVIMVKELLERKGYCVSGYTDQNEALAAARAEPGRFDLVVTDYNMPGMSGLEVARALREIRADLPILMASGNITQEIRVEAPEAGVNELIFKPYTIEKLLQAIDRQTQAQRRNRKAG
jgi:PAS domain S-box-containing protein